MIFRETPYSTPTTQQYALIGRVIAEWAIVEQLINYLLGRLIGASAFPMRAITERLTGAGREEAVELLTEIHRTRYAGRVLGQEDLEILTQIRRRFQKLKLLRNDAAHLLWMRWDDNKMFVTGLTARLPEAYKGQRKDGVVVTNSEIENWLSQATVLNDEIEALLKRLPERAELT